MKKASVPIVLAVLFIIAVSCKKEKCQYYNDIMQYYDQSEAAWSLRYEQGGIDSMMLHDQLYKIGRERADLTRQYKDCVKD